MARNGEGMKDRLVTFVTWMHESIKGTHGQPVMARGLPANYPDPTKLITNDCIQPPTPQ